MKSFVALSFLLLLLYHLIGLPIAALTFDQTYMSATDDQTTDEWKVIKVPLSLPYTSSWENRDGQDGVIQDGDNFYNIVEQQYANDTLYTLLKTNQNAKERFFELTEEMQEDDQEAGKSPLGRLLKLLKERLTTYLAPTPYRLSQPGYKTLLASHQYASLFLAKYSAPIACYLPPPESAIIA